MADINQIMTDVKKENEGVWTEFAAGIELLIARARNPRYNECIRDKTEHIKVDLRNEDFDKDEFADLLLQVRAETILLDWKNIEENGQSVPYSSAKAMEYFRNPGLKDFYKFVVAVSENADRFMKETVKDSEKN
jgi:predicted glycosyl hydrolase (DUF1957 family)